MWFWLGDMVWWDNEGWVYFYDCIGDIFCWKFENVLMVEVSEIFGLYDFIREVNVYGV